MSANPLDIIAAPVPAIPDATVVAVLAREYGLAGALTPLVSERDQNYRLETAAGQRFVVKIANGAEPFEITDFQLQALQFLEERACPVAVPRVIRTEAGEASTTIEYREASHVLRVVSYVPGTPLEGTQPGPGLAFELGKALGQLDRSLQGFSHPGESQVLLWDMQRAGHLRDVVHHVPRGEVLDLVTECLDRFGTVVEPAFAELRTQVIHNDLNPGNVLVTDSLPPAVAGVIDFGDMLRAPLVVDLAIAASYLRAIDSELSVTRSLVAGFQTIIPLHDAEKNVLFDLVRTRLATTITIMYWRASARPSDDPYLRKALQERSSERFLLHVSAIGHKSFSSRIFGPVN
jgi:Ser/Thr protein kinase RdoA (MazF antagonist)